MEDRFVEDVYETLQGETNPAFVIPGVEDAFEEGKKCAILYKEVYDAQRRLEERLDVDPYDEDVERIITALLDIQKELCLRCISTVHSLVCKTAIPRKTIDLPRDFSYSSSKAPVYS